MRRVFWIALGATAGVLVVRKLTKTAESYTPEGVAKGLAGLGEGLREMAQVVREAMDERDAELRLALGCRRGCDRTRARSGADRPPDGRPRVGDRERRRPGEQPRAPRRRRPSSVGATRPHPPTTVHTQGPPPSRSERFAPRPRARTG